MAIGIDDLDDLDDVTPIEETPSTEETVEESSEEQVEQTEESSLEVTEEGDAISDFLKTRGITDPTKIKFENEDGDIEERSWSDLSKEEQLNILSTSNSDPDRALEDSEINLINEIRLSGLSIEEYKNNLIQQALDNQEQPAPVYEIDKIPDDELYVADLQQKLGEDITDEELVKALEAEKQNPELYAKKIKGLRAEYKALEDQLRNAQAEEAQKQYQEQVALFQQNVLNEILGLNKIGNLDIDMELDDMNDVANFILSSDAAGVNNFAKALNDPQLLVKAAWFLTKGEQAFNDITDYFTQLIKEVSKAQYKKGLEDGKKGKSSVKKPSVVKTTPTKLNNTPRSYTTIDDLD